MNTSLSFRKESIQRSSNASEALNQSAIESRQAQGLKHEQAPWQPTLTTTLTTIN